MYASIPADRVRRARGANAATFLKQNFPHGIIPDGPRLRLASCPSVLIYPGGGWYDESDGRSGNAVDLLTSYLGYGFTNAVDALTETLVLPPRAATCAAVVNDLKEKHIPETLIRALIAKGLLYEESGTGLPVYLSQNADYFESRNGSSGTGIWEYVIDPHGPTYLCAGAEEAIALYALDKKPGIYASAGIPVSASRIKTVTKNGHTVLALPPGMTGSALARRNPEIETIFPETGSWLTDLANSPKEG